MSGNKNPLAYRQVWVNLLMALSLEQKRSLNLRLALWAKRSNLKVNWCFHFNRLRVGFNTGSRDEVKLQCELLSEMLDRFWEDCDAPAESGSSQENRRRVRRAARALKAWLGSEEPDEADARDLVCDLMHLMHAQGGEGPKAQVRMAMEHFYTEK